MKYYFDETVAKKAGVEEAIILSNIEYWVKKNAANDRHFYDGFYWSYNSQEAFQKLFSFWTRRQVQRILKKLVDKAYLKSENFNKSGYDKTLWYTSQRPEFLEELAELEKVKKNTAKTAIAPDGAMDSTKPSNPEHQTVQPIPNDKPNIKPTVNINGNISKLRNMEDLDQTVEKSDYVATEILNQLGDKHSSKYYKLIATKIPEATIRQALAEIKNDGSNDPAKVFTYRMEEYARKQSVG